MHQIYPWREARVYHNRHRMNYQLITNEFVSPGHNAIIVHTQTSTSAFHDIIFGAHSSSG